MFEGRFNDSEVALKEIYQHLMNGDIDAVSKEARILASLRHPNIVTFYGMWEHLDVELSTSWCFACPAMYSMCKYVVCVFEHDDTGK